ncbi:MAG: GntR family transcriptional regulator [Reyranella sp.]|uniref:GntR family transcriptional regulator n=1 Tax=Reyranella sp. TaxID=1929291 RepID=UPI003D0F4D5C
MSPRAPVDTSLRSQVYGQLRDGLTAGRLTPGQKLTFRTIAGSLGVSMTPVREAIRRMVAEGAFEMQPNRSVRVPLMTRDRVLELRDLRMAVEGLGAGKAALVATRTEIARLRRIAEELMAARRRGDFATDREKIREFHFSVAAIARQPALQRIVEGLWLQTGPYLNLLYPDYVASPRGPERRLRLIRALQTRDAAMARREMEADIGGALTYVAGLADSSGRIAPASPVAVKRRRRPASAPPAGGFAFV